VYLVSVDRQQMLVNVVVMPQYVTNSECFLYSNQIVGNRPKCPSRRNECRVSCLQSVRRAALTPPVNVGVLNARSVHVNSASICEWISFSNLRLAAVVETWSNSRDGPDLIACTPPGFTYIERARRRRRQHAYQPW